MSLARYNRKRNFNHTPEPRGQKGRPERGVFMMHKHDARRLHYDLRLEHKGVLLSWAVTRGPSLNPKDKRLAVHVEDHPLEYGSFEGIIPAGNYGAGAVLIFDRGFWQPRGDVTKAMEKGHIEFELFGQKLAGRWHLVRLPKEGKQDNWLLIKADDVYADNKSDVTKAKPLSIKSGLSISEIFSQRSPAPLPKLNFIAPMLARVATKPPEGDDWVHEVKFDGYRMQVHIAMGTVALFSRQGRSWSDDLPELSKYFAQIACQNAILDGELVALDAAGKSDFGLLQQSFDNKGEGLIYYAFDILHLNNCDLRPLPLKKRRQQLAELFEGNVDLPIKLSPMFDEKGSLVFDNIRRLGLEGVVSKRKSSLYLSKQADSWRKIRATKGQEFVVGGYTTREGDPSSLGSLLVGAFDNDRFIYYGRVGTGFNAKSSVSLLSKLKPYSRHSSPFFTKMAAKEKRKVVFVTPKTVVEVAYLTLTSEGRLRHASFKGLRRDKKASAIVFEGENVMKSVDSEVKITHGERLYWPDRKISKQMLVDYYQLIWPKMAPHVANRPLALLRCPDGISGTQFFQKHPWPGMDEHIKVHKNGAQTFVSIESVNGLMALGQAAVLEIHPWGTTVEDIKRCNRIVMDLDPDVAVDFALVRDAAREIRERLLALGLDSFVKTSGGKGLHVVSDLPKPMAWQDIKILTQYIADAMCGDSPKRYVAVASKARRKGKIFIDHFRNRQGATAVAAFSPRARPKAPVSQPIEWDKLDEVNSGSMFELPI